MLGRFLRPNIMETYRSGDVAEHCRWQIQRGIRSGSGRIFYTAVLKKSGTATGHNGAPRSVKI